MNINTWQPIDSAPKDGTYILLHGGDIKPWTTCGYWDEKFTPVYSENPDDPHYRGAWTDNTVASWNYEEYTELCPRFWMPLPKPPES